MDSATLKKVRKRLKWSQNEAAAKLEVGLSTYQRWEADQAKPQQENDRKIDEVYGPALKAIETEEASQTVKTQKTSQSEATTPNKAVSPEASAASSNGWLSVPPATPNDIPSFLSSDLTMRLESLVFVSHDVRFDIPNRMAQILGEFKVMSSNIGNYQQNRRDALSRLMLLPFVTLGLDKHETQTLPAKYSVEDVLTQCTAGIAACKELSKGSNSADIRLAFRTASRYIVVLQSLIDFSSEHHKEASKLVAQCFCLKSILARHIENLQQAAIYAEEAVKYAQIAGDPALLISMQINQAWVCYSDQRTDTGIVVINQALPLLKGMPQATAAGVLSTQSVLEAKKSKKSPKSFNQIRDLMQSLSNDEAVFTEPLISELIWNEGIVHYFCREYGDALGKLGQLIDVEDLSAKMPISTRTRTSVLNYMTLASLKRPNKVMEQTMLYWEETLRTANKLGSRLYFLKALTAFDIIEVLWPNEQRVIDGRDLIVELEVAEK